MTFIKVSLLFSDKNGMLLCKSKINKFTLLIILCFSFSSHSYVIPIKKIAENLTSKSGVEKGCTHDQLLNFFEDFKRVEIYRYCRRKVANIKDHGERFRKGESCVVSRQTRFLLFYNEKNYPKQKVGKKYPECSSFYKEEVTDTKSHGTEVVDGDRKSSRLSLPVGKTSEKTSKSNGVSD